MLPTSGRPQLRLLVALVAVVALGCGRSATPAPEADPAIAEFRSTEREVLLVFNSLLRQQKANQIDEPRLGAAIAADVLPRWRELRAHFTAAPVPDGNRELHAAIARYLAERETAWDAYVAGLTATGDDARRHYDAYHEHDAAADAAAREVGAQFRARGL